MGKTWGGSDRKLGSWTLTVDDVGALFSTAVGPEPLLGTDASRLKIRNGWFSRSLLVAGSPPRRFKGVRKPDADEIQKALDRLVARSRIAGDLALAVAFKEQFDDLIDRHVQASRWIAHDAAAPLIATCPASGTSRTRSSSANIRDVGRHLSEDERKAVAFLDEDHWSVVRSANEQILKRELVDRRAFFDRVETSPLTEQQAEAVVAYDSRSRVIAAAGSGKTSVMVARAAYAVDRGFASPDRILLLAFNADAAAELRQRVKDRFGALNLSADGIEASTFHSFGRSLIGRATGRKPSIAPWVDQGQELLKIMEIVDRLRDSSADFRFKWDMFRLLFGRVSEEPDGGEPDSYDRSERRTGFLTYRGETVRSQGERLIADWLFLNGVDYEYERPYSHDVADSTHAQYRPDFFYPQANVWHEHWALRADGTPPPSFLNYAESMAWKKDVHSRFGTPLVETRWNEIIDLSGFDALAQDLKRHGLELDWNPDRPIPGAKPLEHERLGDLVGTFMSHVKAGSLSADDVSQRLSQVSGAGHGRAALFVDLYWPIHELWQMELRSTGAIDFDDMLIQAADLLEHDPLLAAYDLVLVDEFQDSSRARARLTKALVAGPGKHLLAVGDDWQAINRFAGADLSMMTQFDEYFGPTTTVHLETTFRCTQAITDVSSRFVTRNPSQIAKNVKARSGSHGEPVSVVRVASRDQLASAIDASLERLAQSDPGASVDILGRYGFDRHLVSTPSRADLDVTFRTVHGAKGLEADYVLLPNMTVGTYGFPSQIQDDPVLGLVLAGGDAYPHSEERRLFYVALTRARRQVTLFTVVGLESPFVVELLTDPDVKVVDESADVVEVRVCPGCNEGTLVPRSGPYGDFLGCSRFPKCRQTVRL